MKLNYKRTLLVGLAFLSICAFWQLYDNVVPLILKNTFDIPDDIAGVIMALDNVLALFLLPLFGKLSDRTHTRLGRRMPYIPVSYTHLWTGCGASVLCPKGFSASSRYGR